MGQPGEFTLVTHGPKETRAAAAQIATLLQPRDIVLLSGELGSGKTVFVQGLAAGLGVNERVTSPTFTLPRSYAATIPLVHVDVYRLDRVQELFDLGLDEFGDDAVLAVEWGDAVSSHLPGDRLEVELAMTGPDRAKDDDRFVTMTLQGRSWWRRRDALLAVLTGVWQ